MNSTSRASRRLIAGAAIACAAIFLPAAALAASSGPSTRHQHATAVARCGIAHPAIRGGAFVWSSNPGDGFAGGTGFELEITNTGRHTCTLRGVPGVAAVRNGHLVGGRVPGSGRGPLVTLRPGGTAHVLLTVHSATAQCGSNAVTAEVVLYLSGHSQRQEASMNVEACPGRRGGGVLGVSAIHAGTGIPLYLNLS